MGNLLNSPIIEKDTHVGRTVDQYSFLQHSHENANEEEDGGGGGGTENKKSNSNSTSSPRTSSSSSSAPDGGGLHYGISSMQGWRIHMEDAHIAQPYLFAEEVVECSSSSSATSFSASASSSPFVKSINDATEKGNDENWTTTNNLASNANDSNQSNNNDNKSIDNNNNIIHPLHNHSLFAVFDGHGGKYAAYYSSQNLLRILSRNSNFVQYARGWNGRGEYLEKVKRECGCSSRLNGGGGGKEKLGGISSKTTSMKDAESSTSTRGNVLGTARSESGSDGDGNNENDDATSTTSIPTATTNPTTASNTMEDDNDDRHRRLRQLKKRGHECDERVRAIKDQVRRCFEETEEEEEEEEGDAEIVNDGDEVEEDDGDNVSDEIAANGDVSNNHYSLDNDDVKEEVNGDDDEGYTDAYYRAEAAHDRHLMFLLESSLRDAFLDLDAELLAAMRGDGSTSSRGNDANTPYGAGYELDKLLGYASNSRVRGGENSGGEYSGGVGHLPKEFSKEDPATMKDDGDDDDDDNSNNDMPKIEVDAGTTAVVVLLTPKWIVCANAGDSRAVYSRSSHRSVPLSYDHKPTDDAEERRIRNAGGYVAGGRVEADLAVSRGLGDFRFKELDVVASGSLGENRADGKKRGSAVAARGDDDAPMMRPSEQKVSPLPDIIVQNRDPKEDEFIVLACDGIWDVQTNQECVRMVADIFADGENDLGLVCEEVRVCGHALGRAMIL